MKLRSFLLGIFCLGFFVANPARAQFGIWTSDYRSISTGTADIATAFGRQQGYVSTLGPLTVYASTTGFGTFDVGVPVIGGGMRSFYTPNSFVVRPFTENRFRATFVGQVHEIGTRTAQSIQATFHIDEDTPFTLSSMVPSNGPLGDIENPPTLTGPQNQIISMNYSTSGMLSAGTWIFRMDTDAAYPSTVVPAGSATPGFVLTIPEPASASIACMVGCVSLLRRRRSHRT